MKDLVVVTGENVDCLNITKNVKIQLAAKCRGAVIVKQQGGR